MSISNFQKPTPKLSRLGVGDWELTDCVSAAS
jgi:hypothetical protein